MLRDPFEIDFSEILQLKNLSYNRSERSLFLKLTDCILKEEKRLFLRGKNYTPKSIRRILFNVKISNPIVFGLKKIHVFNERKGTYVYFEYYDENNDWKNRIRDKVRELYGSISIDKCKTDLEIELAVNDWMCEHCTYCMDMDNHAKHSVLGILLEGKGVCSSFALCTCLLLNCFGVKCFAIDGKLNSPGDKDFLTGICPKDLMDDLLDPDELNKPDKVCETPIDRPIHFSKELGFEQYDFKDFVGHAWNYVEVEGRGRHLDVTFNNGYHKQSSRNTKHSFFNMTNNEIRKDRHIFFGPGSIKNNK